MKIAIIGGGASGLMSGGFLSQQHDVVIFDGNEKLGKKLFITGKGRCNLTNDCDSETFFENVINGQKFMFSSFNQFNCQDTMDFFTENGLSLKVERGNRVFPTSDKSSDVIKTLERHCQNCEIRLNEKVVCISKQKDLFSVKSDKGEYFFDRVIIACGGKSYPGTGSSGDGYKFAKMLGHEVVSPRPALVPIRIKDSFCSSLEGLSLKNVSLTAKIDGKAHSLFGEMLFTFDAISGPIALSMSSYMARAKEVDLKLDFKPALNEETLENRLLKEFEDAKNKNITYVIKNLLPRRLVDVFLIKSEINPEQKVNSITVAQRKTIVGLLKNFPLEYAGLYSIEAGIITSGGVSTNEVNPKTMESKIVGGLYFVGEILDVDCLTGGFNLQVAFSTAVACARNLK